MRIAILGSTSQIAKDLIISFSCEKYVDFYLFARDPRKVVEWIKQKQFSANYIIDDYDSFGKQDYDLVINFVGAGNPALTIQMGASIYDITIEYDQLAINYLKKNPKCRYIFLSSGAAYCSNFNLPVDENSEAIVNINNIKSQDWYAIAKLHAECRHRALAPLSIIDIRVFNYFSSSQDIEARFLITDIIRTIRDEKIFTTSADFMMRDYIIPEDFYSLINSIINYPATNQVIDSFSRAPVEKTILLEALHKEFGLNYEFVTNVPTLNATGSKPNYYSLNKRANLFGYSPKYSSLEGLMIEIKKIFVSLG